ncbi:MAG: branched-chain amino acid ABC transporter permease [Actinomycetota bacterium]|nr:branched-chain amino acid ABC transporter permease [Actinomycetota bacterium]
MIDFLVIAGVMVGFFVILASGLNLQWGLTGLANFGPVGFFALGAYVTGLVMVPPPEVSGRTTDSFLFALGWPWPAGLALALAVTAVAALLLGYALLRTDLEPLFVAVITLAFAEILFLLLVTQKWLANGFNGIRGIDRPFGQRIGFDDYDTFFLVVVLAVAAVVFVFVRYVQSSPYGRVLKGIREDPAAVQALGHDIRAFRLSAFVIGCLIMALAGALWVPFVTVVDPSAFGTEQTFLIWAVLIIGGSGNAWGPVVGGALVVGLVQQGTRFLPAGQAFADLVGPLRGVSIGVLMILFLRFRPDGMAAESERRIAPADR